MKKYPTWKKLRERYFQIFVVFSEYLRLMVTNFVCLWSSCHRHFIWYFHVGMCSWMEGFQEVFHSGSNLLKRCQITILTLFRNESITNINYPELLTAFLSLYNINAYKKSLQKLIWTKKKKINFLSGVLNPRLFKFFKSKANLT